MLVEFANLFTDEWDEVLEHEGFQIRGASIRRRVGAELIGGSVYEVQPGQRTFPYHFHHAQEEWLIVLRGTPTLRDPNGERTLAEGDVVVFKRGPAGAHLVRNDTSEPVRLLMLSTKADVEIAEYPDSGKIGVFGKDLRKMLRGNAEIDYFEGED